MNPPLPADPSSDTALRNSPPVPDRDDEELLRDYRASRDEPAFRALVRRHFPAVWSAARRLVNGDAALAEDISQEVFTHLATHAHRLPPRVVLGGWLHRHTCFTAAKTLRAAVRRRSREQLAAADMNPSPHAHTSDSSLWPDIAPQLDAALNALPASDRNALVLRYFEKRGFGAIACVLNTSEDAVRMRTNRALEKLRRLLGKPGSLLTTAVLAGLLRENSVAASALSTASAATAARIATAALTRATLPATGAAAGFAAFTAMLHSARPALIGGSAVVLAVAALWKWNAAFNDLSHQPTTTLAAGSAAASRGKLLAEGPKLDITVHFLLVPEAEALALMNERWNGDGDTALLAKLLKEAAPAPADGVSSSSSSSSNSSSSGGGIGVILAQTLSGSWGKSGSATLQNVREVPSGPKYGAEVSHPEETPEIVKVGTVAEISSLLPDDGQYCDLKLNISHHFAAPVAQLWPAGPGEAPQAGPSTVETTEFREAAARLLLRLRPGESSLIQCSQLPALSTGPPAPSTRRLLTFVTAQAISPS